jgi:5'-3' exonuclease
MAVKKTFEFFFGPLLKKFFQDMGRDPNNLEMILLRQKAGQQLKDSTKVIPFKQKRSFAEEIDAMKKSGDLVDEDNIIISDKITDRDMFKNSNLNKPTENEIKAAIEAGNKRAVENLKKKNKMKKDEPDDEKRRNGNRRTCRILYRWYHRCRTES